METLFLLVSVLVALSFVVFVHEFGHLLAAKLTNVYVESFAVGIPAVSEVELELRFRTRKFTLRFGLPPQLFARQIGETFYSASIFLLGGFCKLPHDEDEPRSFVNASKKVRALIMVAGVLMNVIVAVTLVTIIYTINHPEAGVVEAIGTAIYLCLSILVQSLTSIFTDIGGLVGPVGTGQIITGIVGQAANTGNWLAVVALVALLNLAIAAFNLLPIPITDGGRLLFIGLEALGIKSKRVEMILNGLSAALLLVLMVILTTRDIVSPIHLP